jgi:hypothetical protein
MPEKKTSSWQRMGAHSLPRLALHLHTGSPTPSHLSQMNRYSDVDNSAALCSYIHNHSPAPVVSLPITVHPGCPPLATPAVCKTSCSRFRGWLSTNHSGCKQVDAASLRRAAHNYIRIDPSRRPTPRCAPRAALCACPGSTDLDELAFVSSQSPLRNSNRKNDSSQLDSVSACYGLPIDSTSTPAVDHVLLQLVRPGLIPLAAITASEQHQQWRVWPVLPDSLCILQ